MKEHVSINTNCPHCDVDTKISLQMFLKVEHCAFDHTCYSCRKKYRVIARLECVKYAEETTNENN